MLSKIQILLFYLGPAASKPGTPNNREPIDEECLFPGIETKLEVSDHGRTMDYDDSKIDDDLDKLLQHIKEDQQNSMDAPDSPKEDALAGHGTQEGLDSKIPSSHSRHLLYTTHFPLPQVIINIQNIIYTILYIHILYIYKLKY